MFDRHRHRTIEEILRDQREVEEIRRKIELAQSDLEVAALEDELNRVAMRGFIRLLKRRTGL